MLFNLIAHDIISGASSLQWSSSTRERGLEETNRNDAFVCHYLLVLMIRLNSEGQNEDYEKTITAFKF